MPTPRVDALGILVRGGGSATSGVIEAGELSDFELLLRQAVPHPVMRGHLEKALALRIRLGWRFTLRDLEKRARYCPLGEAALLVKAALDAHPQLERVPRRGYAGGPPQWRARGAEDAVEGAQAPS